jgi:hypothetical protein
MKCLRVLTLLAALGAASSASAQVVISGNYYEEFSSIACGANSECFLVFSATPQNVFITDVSCRIITSGAAPVSSVIFGVSDFAVGTSSPRRLEYFIPVNVTANIWVVRSKAGFLFGAGRWPEIIVTASGTVNTTGISCKISGTFVVP